jgi:hypothetical protein
VPVALHRHTVTVFALQVHSSPSLLRLTSCSSLFAPVRRQLLLNAFRKNKLNTNQPQTLQMLDPFVPLLRNCCLALGMPQSVF